MGYRGEARACTYIHTRTHTHPRTHLLECASVLMAHLRAVLNVRHHKGKLLCLPERVCVFGFAGIFLGRHECHHEGLELLGLLWVFCFEFLGSSAGDGAGLDARV